MKMMPLLAGALSFTMAGEPSFMSARSSRPASNLPCIEVCTRDSNVPGKAEQAEASDDFRPSDVKEPRTQDQQT